MLKNFHHARYFFFLFAAMGIVSPYLGWWLQQVLPTSSASIVLACFYATLIVTPSVWGHAAFSSNKPGRWLSRGTLLAAIFALGLTQIHEITPLIACCFLMIAFGIFYNPLMSLLDAIAYSQVADTHVYSRIRLYGSLGFLLFSSIIGGMVVLSHPSLFPFFVSGTLLLTYAVSWPYRQSQTFETNLPNNLLEVFPRLLWKLKGLWVVVVASQVAFVMYYTYIALHLSSVGFSNMTIGLLIGVATMAEIAAFWKIKWFFARFSPWILISLASLITVVRWVAIGLAVDNVIFLIGLTLVQLLHALSFTVFHTACLKIIHDEVSPREMGLAQGLYNALGYGVGGVLGVLWAAHIWMSSQAGVFFTAAWISLGMSIFAFLVYLRAKRFRT